MSTIAEPDIVFPGIPQELQARAAAVARRAGLSLVDIVRMTFTRLADDGCLPFDPFDAYADEIPNEETLEAIRELDEGNLPVYDSYEDMMAAIEREDAAEAAAQRC